jgi:hypothetical protein
MQKGPVTYIREFLPDADDAFSHLSALEWERRGSTPRFEYYCNEVDKPYVYGRGMGRRIYYPRPWHPTIIAIKKRVEHATNTKFEVCFLNRYMNHKDQLGWHSDDSPEMDDARAIAIISLGAAREIWFRPIPFKLIQEGEKRVGPEDRRGIDRASIQRRDGAYTNKLLLEHGSLCLMAPGMQDQWQHRIPKASHRCDERISLTFRGYVEVSDGSNGM